MRNCSIFEIVVFFSFFCVVAQGFCNYTASDGWYYDLSSLKLVDSAYSYVASNFEYIYEVNVCGNLPLLCYSLPSAVCRTTDFRMDFAHGSWAGAVFADYPGGLRGVQLNYVTGGEPCPGPPGQSERTSTLNIECDPSAARAYIHNVEDRGECNIIVNMRAAYLFKLLLFFVFCSDFLLCT